MFTRLARLAVHHPWKIIAAWLLATIAVTAFAPGLSDVVARATVSFLPDRYESIQANQLAERAFGQTGDSTAVIVVRRTDGQPLTEADRATANEVARRVQSAGIDRVTSVVTGPQAVSSNGQIQLVSVGLRGNPTEDPAVTEAVKRIRDTARPALSGTPLRMAVTGTPALVLDNQEGVEKAFRVVGIATVVLIIGLLLLIYRSPVAALLPVVTVAIVLAIAPRLVAVVAKVLDFQVATDLEITMTVVLYGVGTDYILFLLFRYREGLRAGEAPRQALVHAVHRVGDVITSAAGAIVVAFSTLLLAVFGAFTTLGPGLAIAVAIMALAALTLVPAVVALIGPKVFWPSKSWRRTPKNTIFKRLGRCTGRRPAVVALASGGVMAALALGALPLKIDYDAFGQLPRGTEAGRGIEDLEAGFPAGALNPTTVYLRSESGGGLDMAAVERYAAGLATQPGVGGILRAPDGSAALLNQDGTVASIRLLLSASPYSNPALDVAGGTLRDAAHAQAPAGTEALVGGVSAEYADIRDANNRDLRTILPVAGLLIGVILALLLRSLVAPLYLMAVVLLAFFSTLGATVLAVQGVLDRPGVSYAMPILLYLFVVAVGTDYNILMIARLREEARAGKDPRTAAALAIEHAGPSVGAAGVILAGTFASLMLAGIALLVDTGLAVATGIIISAFVMSMFLIPSITALLGHRAWWPGHEGTPTRPRRIAP